MTSTLVRAGIAVAIHRTLPGFLLALAAAASISITVAQSDPMVAVTGGQIRGRARPLRYGGPERSLEVNSGDARFGGDRRRHGERTAAIARIVDCAARCLPLRISQIRGALSFFELTGGPDGEPA